MKALQERIAKSELGQEWINNLLLDKDVWSIQELGYSEEESKIEKIRNIYFKEFSLPWFKLLAKLTVLSMARAKFSSSTIQARMSSLKQFDSFLLKEGYNQPELISGSLIEKFLATGNKRSKRAAIAYASKLWAEEQWLKLPYKHRRYGQPKPSIEIIPEEVLHQIYLNFDLFPLPLERLLRLQLALGCRIGEMSRMPRQCLKREGEQWFLLRWIQKRKHWRFFQVHPTVAELVREQQKFLDKQLDSNPEFDKLFCKLSTATHDGVKGINQAGINRFDVEPAYLPSLLSRSLISLWLRAFSEKADLKDQYGKRFYLNSHQFRRTKASVMAYCEAEDEYIAAVLGHGSLDMLPHYRKRSLERLEKEAKEKGYVDKYGRVTSFR